MYRTFTRNWWRKNANYPGGLEPHAGRKTYTGHTYQTIEEARKECTEHARNHRPGKLSNKMEFESF